VCSNRPLGRLISVREGMMLTSFGSSAGCVSMGHWRCLELFPFLLFFGFDLLLFVDFDDFEGCFTESSWAGLESTHMVLF
jgi:hypothetical protein